MCLMQQQSKSGQCESVETVESREEKPQCQRGVGWCWGWWLCGEWEARLSGSSESGAHDTTVRTCLFTCTVEGERVQRRVTAARGCLRLNNGSTTHVTVRLGIFTCVSLLKVCMENTNRIINSAEILQ